MIDIVYVLGSGSKWENNEIRYSLRSVEKYLQNYRNIYIVGERPDFLQNIIHIPAEDLWHPSRNILEKILKACRTQEISSKFMFMNDDHFLLQETNAPTYPYYHSGELATDLVKYTPGNWYKNYLQETIAALKEKNLTTANYDCHTPIIYHKKWFIEKLQAFDFTKKILIKSAYANSWAHPSEYIKDCKIKGWKSEQELNKMISGQHIFSTGDQCLADAKTRRSAVKVFLEKSFPQKSRYEL
jgi:hypothetical protein